MYWTIQSSLCNNEVFCVSYSMNIERLPCFPYVYVNSSRTVKNSKFIQVVSACSLETYAFPFDIQNGSLTFNSILHTDKLWEVQSSCGKHTCDELARIGEILLCHFSGLFLHIIDFLQIEISFCSYLAPAVTQTKYRVVPRCIAYCSCWFGNTILGLYCHWEHYKSLMSSSIILWIVESKPYIHSWYFFFHG